MNNRMLFNLYKLPTFFLFLSVVILLVIPKNDSTASGSVIDFSSLLIQFKYFGAWASLLALSVSLLLFLFSSFRIYRWTKGKGELCFQCGGIKVYRHGRYGPYYKCLACGKNESIK